MTELLGGADGVLTPTRNRPSYPDSTITGCLQLNGGLASRSAHAGAGGGRGVARHTRVLRLSHLHPAAAAGQHHAHMLLGGVRPEGEGGGEAIANRSVSWWSMRKCSVGPPKHAWSDDPLTAALTPATPARREIASWAGCWRQSAAQRL
jgi:hypothetical protein